MLQSQDIITCHMIIKRETMPRDFRNFSKEQTHNTNNQDINQYQDLINKYKDMSKDDLIKNLFSEATRLKQSGKLDNNSLESLRTTLSPMLNNEQKQMLDSLISMLK